MVFLDWLATAASRRSGSRQPFVSMYDTESEDSDSNDEPVPRNPGRRAAPTGMQSRDPWTMARPPGYGTPVPRRPAAPGRGGTMAGPFGWNIRAFPQTRSNGQRSGPKTRTKCGQHTAIALDKTNTYMPPSSGCLTPWQLLTRMSGRYKTQVNHEKLASHRSWIQNTIIPRMNRHGGRAVQAAEMQKLIDFFGEFIFWNALPRTRFRWVDYMCEDDSLLGCTSDNGTLIEMDPDPHGARRRNGCLGNDLLSTLVHECCHAIFDQCACNGKCWSRRCATAFQEDIEPHGGHGSAWIRLAQGAEDICNREKLFKCRTGHETY